MLAALHGERLAVLSDRRRQKDVAKRCRDRVEVYSRCNYSALKLVSMVHKGARDVTKSRGVSIFLRAVELVTHSLGEPFKRFETEILHVGHYVTASWSLIKPHSIFEISSTTDTKIRLRKVLIKHTFSVEPGGISDIIETYADITEIREHFATHLGVRARTCEWWGNACSFEFNAAKSAIAGAQCEDSWLRDGDELFANSLRRKCGIALSAARGWLYPIFACAVAVRVAGFHPLVSDGSAPCICDTCVAEKRCYGDGV